MSEDLTALIEKAITEAREINEKRDPSFSPFEKETPSPLQADEGKERSLPQSGEAAAPPQKPLPNAQPVSPPSLPLSFLPSLSDFFGKNGNDLLLYAVAFMLFKEKSDNDLLLALLYVILGK